MIKYFYEIYYRTANEVGAVYSHSVPFENEARDDCFVLGLENPQNYYFYEAKVGISVEE
jgi:hypothetical protein